MPANILRIVQGLAILAVAALLPVLLPDFLIYQISLALTYATAIIGLNLLLGFNGQISLAQGVFFAIGGYVAAILIADYRFPYLSVLPIAAAVTAFGGLVVGVPALRLQGLQLAIVTLGLAALVPPLVLKFDKLTRGVNGIPIEKPTPPGWFPGGQDAWIYALCVAGAWLVSFSAKRLMSGDTGRVLRAVRDNEHIADSLGVNVAATRIWAFVASAAMGGFAGGLFTLVNAFVSPDSFAIMKSFELLAGAVIGGITSIAGAFIGALFIVFVPEFSTDIGLAFAGIIYGAALIMMTLVAREGVVGLVRDLIGLIRRRAGRSFSARRVTAVATPQPSHPIVSPGAKTIVTR